MVQEEEAKRRTWLQSLVDEFCGAKGEKTSAYMSPQLHLVQGDASQLVPEIADRLGVELIVMGTVGRTGIPGFLIGNTAENVLNRTPCSVLTIKPAGFVSPVTL